MAGLNWDITTRDRGAAATLDRVANAIDRTGAASRRLEDAQLKVRRASVAAEKAALDLAQAQERLTRVNADANATDEEKRRAALRVEEAQLRQAKAARDAERAQEALTHSDRAVVTTGTQVATTMEHTERSTRSSAKALGVLSGSARGVGTSFKVLGTGVVAATALAGVGVGLLLSQVHGFIDEGREAQRTGAQTNAVLKSTGGVAHVSADQIGNLATAISNKVGVDDEAIQSGENLLLTFTSIRNEAGRGNDVFNQATKAIVDMTAAMNDGTVTTEGLKAQTILVGKALNDPIKGLSALSRVGVSFTAEQQKQIKVLVDHGKALQAQKIILGELNREFAGSAEAATNPTQRLSVVIGNLKESIGTILLPYLDKAANWFADRLPGALQRTLDVGGKVFGFLKDAWHDVSEGFRTGKQNAEDALSSTGTKFQTFGAIIRHIADAATAYAKFIGPILAKGFQVVSHVITGDVIPALVSFGQWVNRNKLTFGIFAAAVAQWVLKIQGYITIMAGVSVRQLGYVIGGFASVLKVVLNVAGGIVAAMAHAFGWIPGLGGRLKTAEDQFNKFKGGVTDALDAAARAAGATGDRLIALGKKTLDASDAAGRLRQRLSELRDRQITLSVLDHASAALGQIIRLRDQAGRSVGIQVGAVGRGVRGFSTGGTVTGGIPGTDSVPALLMPGEEVLNRAQAAEYRRSRGRAATWTGQPAAAAQPIVIQLVMPDGSKIAEALFTYDRTSGGSVRRRLAPA